MGPPIDANFLATDRYEQLWEERTGVGWGWLSKRSNTVRRYVSDPSGMWYNNVNIKLHCRNARARNIRLYFCYVDLDC